MYKYRLCSEDLGEFGEIESEQSFCTDDRLTVKIKGGAMDGKTFDLIVNSWSGDTLRVSQCSIPVVPMRFFEGKEEKSLAIGGI